MQPAPRDRRSTFRYPSPGTSALATLVHQGRRWRAYVHDVSSEGVGLYAPEPLPVGAAATVELSTTSGLFARTLEFSVRHARELVDGRYLVGGCFTSDRLSREDLAALLARPQLR